MHKKKPRKGKSEGSKTRSRWRSYWYHNTMERLIDPQKRTDEATDDFISTSELNFEGTQTFGEMVHDISTTEEGNEDSLQVETRATPYLQGASLRVIYKYAVQSSPSLPPHSQAFQKISTCAS